MTSGSETPATWSPCSPGCPGWAVFNGNGIQRCDECNRFPDDDAAIAHVGRLYAADSQRAQANADVYRCGCCGSTNVQHVMWVRTNTHEVQDDYGDWRSLDTKWCEDCADHVALISGDPFRS